MTHGELIIRDEPDRVEVVQLITAKSRRALSKEVKERNTRRDTGCGADCTGQVYMTACILLRAYKCGSEWVGIVVTGKYYDV